MHNIRERIRDSGSNANTKIYFEFEPLLYIPAFSQKNFHYIVHTGLPTQGTSAEDLGNINREYTTPLSITNTTSTLRGQAQSHTNTTSHKRGRHLANKSITSHLRDSNTNSTSHQRELNTISTSHQREPTTTPIINLYTRGISQIRRIYNQVVYLNHKQLLFPQNKDPNRQDRMIAQVWKTKSLEIKNSKRNSREKLQIEMQMKIKSIPKEFSFQMIFQPFKK